MLHARRHPPTKRERSPLAAHAAVVLAGLGVLACGPPDTPDRSGGASDVEPSPWAGIWVDRTAELLDSTGEWTNKVELADLDGDGRRDLVVGDGGDY